MAVPFGENAARLAGFATRAFGWTPEQFWAATPAELAVIIAAEEPDKSAPLSRRELDALLESDAHD